MSVEVQAKEEMEKIDFGANTYQVEFDTSMGKVLLNLFPDVAPNHCKNIIALSKIGFYDNLTFHRVIDGFVIQGGCPEGTGTGGPGYNVDAEFNSKPHELGVLSMARAGHPDSAGSQFFLCLGKVPYLDNQYTVFGEAANDESREVISSIGKVKTGGGDKPLEDITINKATVIES
jgi:peptidyl-prolyl cis-trans isomerase B (cyclophilin B)